MNAMTINKWHQSFKMRFCWTASCYAGIDRETCVKSDALSPKCVEVQWIETGTKCIQPIGNLLGNRTGAEFFTSFHKKTFKLKE